MKTTKIDKRLLGLIIILAGTICASFFGLKKVFYLILGFYLGIISFLFTDYTTKKNIKFNPLATFIRLFYAILIFSVVGLINFTTKKVLIPLLLSLAGYTIIKGYYITMKLRGKDLC